MAERAGFEPAKELPFTRFPSVRLQPLGTSPFHFLFLSNFFNLDMLIDESNGIPIFDFFEVNFFEIFIIFFCKIINKLDLPRH